MSLLGLFDIGKSALSASQTALSVTSNNIANVNTPGFSKQEVILNVSAPVSLGSGSTGSGVSVGNIKSSYDRFLQSRMIAQNQYQGRSTALDNMLGQVEQTFNEAQGLGLSSSLNSFFNAWQDVSADPSGEVGRIVLLQDANDLVSTAKRVEGGLLDVRQQINGNVDDIVSRVNTLASGIASLNSGITDIEAGGTATANDLRDQRNSLLNELSNLTSLTSYENKDGSVTVMVGGDNLVSGGKASTLSSRLNQDTDKDVYIGDDNITQKINAGQLGGLLAVRNDIISNSLVPLRKLVASVVNQVNQLHGAGYGLDSSNNNFFNPLQISTADNSAGADITSASITDASQLTLDEYTLSFDAANNYLVHNKQSGALVASGAYVSGNPISFEGIQVSIAGTVTAGDSFSVSPLTDAVRNFGVAITDPDKIAASSSIAGLPGNNDVALKIAQLSGDTSVGLGGDTFSGFYNNLVTTVATMSKSATDSLTFDNNLMTELNNRRDSISGVSLDEEAINLVKFQRSYEAGAQLIKVADELLQTVLQLRSPA